LRIASALPLARAAISASILLVLLSRVSTGEVVARAKDVALMPLAAALVLVLLTALLVSVRWRMLARSFGLALTLPFAVRTVFLGMFGGQLLPSTVGTDLVRGWSAARQTGRIRHAAASVLADRLVALVAACLLTALVYPRLGALATLAAGGILAGFMLWGAEGRELRPVSVLGALVVALAIHVVHIVAAAAVAAGYGLDTSLRAWLAIIPVSLIACAVPVSLNGWGVREAVFVALAAEHGIPDADALLVALTLGALNVVASLPGAYVMLVDEK
jgi:uncharacterized membrane protein YbhN (UPF0104 family)